MAWRGGWTMGARSARMLWQPSRHLQLGEARFLAVAEWAVEDSVQLRCLLLRRGRRATLPLSHCSLARSLDAAAQPNPTGLAAAAAAAEGAAPTLEPFASVGRRLCAFESARGKQPADLIFASPLLRLSIPASLRNWENSPEMLQRQKIELQEVKKVCLLRRKEKSGAGFRVPRL